MKQLLAFILVLVVWSGGWYYIASIPAPATEQKPLSKAELAKKDNTLTKQFKQHDEAETTEDSHKLADMILNPSQSSPKQQAWKAHTHNSTDTAAKIWGWFKTFFIDIRITDVLIALFTGMLAWVTWKLANYTKQLGDSTEKLVQGADDTAKKQLRAYLGITEGLRDIIYNKNGSFTFPGVVLHLINYGKVPAHNVRCFWRTVCLPEELEDDFDFENGLSASKGAFSLLPSQDQALICTAKSADGFTPEDMKEIWKPIGYIPHKKLYTYGKIIYNDGFTDDRVLQFCYSIEWREPNAPYSDEKPGFFTYKTHNDAN